MSETRFHSLLKAKMLETIDIQAQSLAMGAAQDYPHYKDITGYIRGLRDALKLCEDVEMEFE